jgi:hypothetical protein
MPGVGMSSGRGVAATAAQGAQSRFTKTENFRKMDQETFNLSIRKFLKMVGVNSQREIEQAVAKAMEAGRLSGSERFPAKVTLEIPALGLNVTFNDEIRLQ